MKKFGRYLLVMVLPTHFIFGLFACSSEKAQKIEIDSTALFEQKCSVCHSIDVAKLHRRKSREWKRIVRRMQREHKCNITNAEAKIIIDYLTKNYGIL